ncbi:MAG: metallophosphoesterase [Mailhella sp.]
MLCTGAYLAVRLFWFTELPLFIKIFAGAVIMLLSQCMFGMRYVVSFTPHMSYFALKVCGYCSAFFICLASFVCLHDIFFYARWYYEKSLPSYGITAAFAFCMLFVSFAAMVYGAWRALKIPAFVYNDLYVKELPEELEGMRIVHLSDLHIGSIFDGKWLGKLVDGINAEQADLIVVTGDLVDAVPAKIEQDVVHLRKLQSLLGMHICLGNHEYFCGAMPWVEKWHSWGFNVYINENKKVLYKNFPFYIAGSADFEGNKFPGLLTPDMEKTLQGIRQEDFVLLLQHQPKKAKKNAHKGVNVQLSGHTHGGQYFFLFPIVCLLNNGYRSGFYEVGDLSLYVSPGSGLWGYVPLRFGTNSEVLVHTLKKKK